MISSVPWSYDEVTGKWGATIDGREITIAWDGGDQSLYLSVIVPQTPNVEGAGPRVYSAPLSLLAAMLLLPQNFHAKLTELVSDSMVEARDQSVVGKLHSVMADSIQPWPKPAVALDSLKAALEAMQIVERLSLDVAASGAFAKGV